MKKILVLASLLLSFALGAKADFLIQPHDVVGIAGDSMYWQVQDRFRFRLAGGYLSISLPPDYRRYIHLITALEGGRVSATAHRELCSFIHFTGTRVILLADGAPGRWGELLDPLGVAPQRLGGLSVYRLRPDASPRGACVR